MRKLVPAVAAAAAAAGVIALPSVAATKPKQIAVKDDYFTPKTVTVKKGTKVVWTWKGKGLHNVTYASGPGKSFGSSNKRKGTYKHTFTTKGKYFIVCSIHAPSMHLTIKVK